MEKSVTVIIQGPASELSIKSLKAYSEEYPVVFSTWEEDTYIIDEIKEIVEKKDTIKLIMEPLPCIAVKVGLLHDTTFYYAVAGMNNALEQVDTEYAIRTRTDEFFEDFQPMISLAMGNPENKDKFICGNIFVRKFSDVPYHIGDHVYIARTLHLKNAFYNLRKMYDGEMQLQPWASQSENIDFGHGTTATGFAAETILGHAFLFAKSVPIKKWPYIDCFVDNFYVLNLALLGDYVVRWGHTDRIWFSDFINPHDVENMSDAVLIKNEQAE